MKFLDYLFHGKELKAMTVANEKAHEKVVEAQRSIWESETGE